MTRQPRRRRCVPLAAPAHLAGSGAVLLLPPPPPPPLLRSTQSAPAHSSLSPHWRTPDLPVAQCRARRGPALRTAARRSAPVEQSAQRSAGRSAAQIGGLSRAPSVANVRLCEARQMREAKLRERSNGGPARRNAEVAQRRGDMIERERSTRGRLGYGGGGARQKVRTSLCAAVTHAAVQRDANAIPAASSGDDTRVSPHA
jgi:hypothetical protein